MKIFLLGIIFCSVVYCGRNLTLKKKKRKDFFADFVIFIKKIKNEINYFSSDIISILEKFTTENNDLKMLNNEFLFSLKNDKIFKGFSFDFLTENEQKIIGEFYNELGTYGKAEEIEKLDFFEAEFLSLKNLENEEYKKIGQLPLKFSILIGIALCILLY